RDDAHARHAGGALVDHLEPLLHGKQRLLGRIRDDGDDELVEDAEAPLDQIQMSVVNRIEHPRIDGALVHAIPRWCEKAPKTSLSLRRRPKKSQGGLPESARLPRRENTRRPRWARLGPVLDLP